MMKCYKVSFNDFELIIGDNDFEKVLEDCNYAKILILEEIKNLESQGINILKHDIDDGYIVTTTQQIPFSVWDSISISDCDKDGNDLNVYRADTNKTIRSSKARIIVDYLKLIGVKHYRENINKNYITFSCPICKKDTLKMCISINGFNISTVSNTDCTDEKHNNAWDKWKKAIKKKWDDSKDKRQLVFNLGISYIKNVIRNSFPIIVKNENILYRYCENTNYYHEMIENMEQSDMGTLIYNNFIGENESFITLSQKKDVKSAILEGLSFPEKQIEPDYLINFKNGIYDVKNNKLTPHSKDYFFTYCLPCDYIPNVITDKLTPIVKDWGIDLLDIKKMLGYCFQSSNHLEKSFYLHGKPNCGKGTFLSMIKYMFAQKCESITIGDIYKDHGTTNIINKTCLLDEDFDNKTFLQNDVKLYNKMISGESYNYNRKFKDQKSIPSTAKFIIAANDYPKFKSENDNGGFRRRTFYIHFTSQYIAGKNQDFSIKQVFKQDLDMQSEFMNWVIEGLKLLTVHNPNEAFFDNQDEIVKEIMKKSEPLVDYLSEYVIVTNNHKQDKIKGSELYGCYKQWCVENCIDYPTGIQTFNKKITEICGLDDKYINKQIKIKGEKALGHTGIKLNDQYINSKLKLIKSEV